MKRNGLIVKIISFVILVPSFITAVYIMANHLGLQDSLDFGAGAYYYADMPNFWKWTDGGAYTSPVSMWVLILLFLLWGALMYKLWIWIDSRADK
ncbi:MAG: hypothetical protein IJ757_07410 [Clostridiales bacterium]|nr:hypothetical protein [Clostridiales bacterium]